MHAHSVRRGLCLSLLAACCLPPPVVAEVFPSRPLRIVVPVPPGGTVDLVARLLSKGLAEELGQPVLVENRPGASTLIGMRHVAQSKPDGYTLLATANTVVSASAFVPDAQYDPLKDFAPVTQTCQVPMVLVTHPSMPAPTLAAFVDLAKQRPGAVTNASSGLGSTGYIAAERFGRAAGVSLLPVSYKGNNPALMDVIGGRVDSMFDQVSTAFAHIQAGKVNAVAVTSATRSPLLPMVPTIAESGYPRYEDVTFNAIMVPAGTPAPVVDRLFRAISKVMHAPEVRRQLLRQGVEVKTSASPAAFGRYLAEQHAVYREIAGDKR